MNNFFKTSSRLFLIFSLMVILSCIIMLFIPVKYPFQSLIRYPNPTFWELPNGSNIYYTKIPANDSTKLKATPIIYLHGGPGGRATEKQIEQLRPLVQEGYDLYFYDQIGGGRSARLEDINAYHAEQHCEDLDAIIKEIGADQVILIGQSWGALLATLYLSRSPEKIAKAIFTSPGPILPIQAARAKDSAPDSLQLHPPALSNRRINQEHYTLRMRLTRWMATTMGRKWVPDQEADRFFTHLNSALNVSTLCDPLKAVPSSGGGGYYAHVMTVKSFREVEDQRARLQQIQTPLLIMKGQCDHISWGYTAEYLTLFPKAVFQLIPNAGHFIANEQEALYLQGIRQFLLSSE